MIKELERPADHAFEDPVVKDPFNMSFEPQRIRAFRIKYNVPKEANLLEAIQKEKMKIKNKKEKKTKAAPAKKEDEPKKEEAKPKPPPNDLAKK